MRGKFYKVLKPQQRKKKSKKTLDELIIERNHLKKNIDILQDRLKSIDIKIMKLKQRMLEDEQRKSKKTKS